MLMRKPSLHHACLVLLACSLLPIILSACKFTTNHTLNPLGYNYVYSQFQATPEAGRAPVLVSQDAKATVYPHVRKPGIGNTLSTFVGQYGQPLSHSHPPTLYLFQAGVDAFPDGSILIVSMDLAKEGATPRATQISYVAGNAHPTTYEQAQAIAEGFLPDDTSLPTQVQAFNDDTDQCLAKSYNSSTLGTIFPPQDFLGMNGKLAKPGDVAVSFFPHLDRSGAGEIVGENIDQTGIVSSVLVTLGSRPAC